MTQPSILKNDLLLRALAGKPVERVPVWMMRQAGRYLPEYIELRNKYSFFERCQNPELATTITLQPIKRLGVDAAILFSDILVIAQAMGMEVELIENKGPVLHNPIRTAKDVENLHTEGIAEKLHYVSRAIQMIQKELNHSIPLIGFAGAPWTMFCYMVQGQGSKTFDLAKIFCYTHPLVAHQLLQKITDATIVYLKAQVAAGVNAVQLFDSWAGLLSPHDFQQFALPYIQQIVVALKDAIPVIVFPKGAWYALKDIAKTGAQGLGIDWVTTAEFARQRTDNQICLQGNFDPAKLLAPRAAIIKYTEKMLKDFGKNRYIANLGHGILPQTPIDNAKIFIETIQGFTDFENI